jgi:hypothetical protein
MGFYFADPGAERLPPSETRLIDLRAEPEPDGKRIRVFLNLTPFQQKPDLELVIFDSAGREISSVSIIEPVEWKLELTLHIRKVFKPVPEAPAEGKMEPSGVKNAPVILQASLYYPEQGLVDQRRLTISLPKQ